MKHEVRIPDIEVVVRAGAFDVAVVAFWREEEQYEGFQVVTGIDNPTSVEPVVAALQKAIEALRESSWKSLAELGAAAGAESDEPPF